MGILFRAKCSGSRSDVADAGQLFWAVNRGLGCKCIRVSKGHPRVVSRVCGYQEFIFLDVAAHKRRVLSQFSLAQQYSDCAGCVLIRVSLVWERNSELPKSSESCGWTSRRFKKHDRAQFLPTS